MRDMAILFVEETKYLEEKNMVVPIHILEKMGDTDVAGVEIEGSNTPEEKTAADAAKKTG